MFKLTSYDTSGVLSEASAASLSSVSDSSVSDSLSSSSSSVSDSNEGGRDGGKYVLRHGVRRRRSRSA